MAAKSLRVFREWEGQRPRSSNEEPTSSPSTPEGLGEKMIPPRRAARASQVPAKSKERTRRSREELEDGGGLLPFRP